MKPRTLYWLGVTAAAAAAVMCWYLLSMEPDSSPRTVGKGLASAAQVTGNGAVSSPAEPLPKFGTPEFKSALKERGEKWLDSRGRDAAGLIAMWDLTRDGRVLFEAERNFYNDPRVCMAMFDAAGGATARWRVQSLITAEPANPQGLYLKAWAFLTGSWEHKVARDGSGGIEALRQAAALNDRRDDHTLERIQTAREAALACGANPGDAVRLALDGPLRRSMTPSPIEGITNALSEELAAANASDVEKRPLDIIRIGLLTADKFSDRRAPTFADELGATDLKIRVLADLPRDTQIAGYERSAGSLREEAEIRHRYLEQCIQRSGEVAAILEAASEDVMVSYANLLLSHGAEIAQGRLLREAEARKAAAGGGK